MIPAFGTSTYGEGKLGGRREETLTCGGAPAASRRRWDSSAAAVEGGSASQRRGANPTSESSERRRRRRYSGRMDISRDGPSYNGPGNVSGPNIMIGLKDLNHWIRSKITMGLFGSLSWMRSRAVPTLGSALVGLPRQRHGPRRVRARRRRRAGTGDRPASRPSFRQ